MKTTLLIPTLNEIEGVKTIMPKVDRSWVDEVIVIDGNSTDGTKEWFEENGYQVISQKLKGGWGAWWEGFQAATGDVIILFSPDGNSLPEKIPELVSKLKEGYKMIIVSRYKDNAKSEDDDWLSAKANWLLTSLINLLFKSRYSDALIMYRAFHKNLIKDLEFTYQTGSQFNRYNVSFFELLLSIRCAKRKIKICEIPGDEPNRIGEGERAHPTKWIKIYNGLVMLYYIFKEKIGKS